MQENNQTRQKTENELIIQRLDIDLKKKELKRKFFFEPANITLFLGIFTIAVGFVSNYFQKKSQLDIEEKKFQYAIYEKALSIENDSLRAKMLDFYINAGLLPGEKRKFTQLLIDSGANSLPSYNFFDVVPINQATTPQKLGIYFGLPSFVNNSRGDVLKAASIFSKFDLIVFGDNLWNDNTSDHLNTLKIINHIKAIKPSIKIFGYIDAGTTSRNLSLDQLQNAIEGWKLMNVDGIFADCFGYDFGTNRKRQNDLIDYAHNNGLSIFVNTWRIEDAFEGEDCHLSGAYNDYYLFENFLVNKGKYGSLQDFNKRVLSAQKYQHEKKIKIACLTVDNSDGISDSSNFSKEYIRSRNAVITLGFDAFQFTDENYSSTNAALYCFP